MKTFFFLLILVVQLSLWNIGYFVLQAMNSANELRVKEQKLQEQMFIMDTQGRIHYLCRGEGKGYYDTEGFHCGEAKKANSNLL